MRVLVFIFACLFRISSVSRKYRLVIYKPDRIGDFILALGTIRTLLKSEGPGNCLLILSPAGDALARLLIPEANTLVLPTGCFIKNWIQFPEILKEFRMLSRIRCDCVISLKHHKREVDFLYLAALKTAKLLSLDGSLSVSRLRGLIPDQGNYPSRTKPGFCKELLAHHAIACRYLGDETAIDSVLPDLHKPGLPVPENRVLVTPFGSSPKRSITPEQVASAIPRSHSRVELTGLISQVEQLKAFKRELEIRDFSDVIVRTFPSLEAYLRAVGEASFVISTETATAHIAAAYGKPGVGFLGGGHFGYFAPWGNGPFRWHYKVLDCYNCGWECIYPEIRCVTEL